MSCGKGGKNRFFYTGNQVGDLNQVGDFNFVAGGPDGSGISAGMTVPVFFPNVLNRRIFERADATFTDALLDATFPYINLQWFAEITLDIDTVFRVSDRSFYVNDIDGVSKYYDARCDKAPSIQVTVGEWLANNYQVSNFSLELNNRDGFFNRYLPQGADFRQWSGAKIVIKVGFSEKYENYLTIFEGSVASKQGLTTTRDTIQIQCYDQLDPDTANVPANAFSADQYPDIARDDSGKMVPLVYGDWSDSVPKWGALPATCINAAEENPSSYSFKVSDLALDSISSVWLHRGDNAADKPAGPLQIESNCVTLELDKGQFSVPTGVPIFNQPYIILDRGKAGPNSTIGLITSDGTTNFIEAGIKVGDRISVSTEETATVTHENIQFLARRTGGASRNGALGNGITVQYTLLAMYTDPTAELDLVVSVVGDAITIGVPSKMIGPTLTYGTHTASAIVEAIKNNSDADNLVQCVITGSVPIGYPPGTLPDDVVQTVPSGPFTLTGGADDDGNGIITSVANFQLEVTGSDSWHEGDEFTVQTVQFSFLDNDKFSVVAKGKPLALASVTRLSDVSEDITAARAVTILPDSTYWVTDDGSQKLYHLDFSSRVIETIDYATIDPSIAELSGVSLGTDGFLWVTEPLQSMLYRVDPATGNAQLAIESGTITGISSNLGYISGVGAKADGRLWIVDRDTSTFYHVDPFSSINPFVVNSFDASAYDGSSTEVTDVAYDESTLEVIAVDRTRSKLYRLDESDGSLISSFDLTDIDPDLTYPSGVASAPDGTVFVLDGISNVIYNWNEASDADTNPCFIARDLLQKFNGRTFADFDISWNQTARQLNGYKARAFISTKTALVTYVNRLLTQFNVTFYLRFQKFALFWIEFNNFRTNGKLVTEKDIQLDQFKPSKETNQYFNSMTATYGKDEFTGKSLTSDTYISPAGISFAGDEYNKKFDMPNIYRRDELDQLIPLFVKLSVPEPEFVDITLAFRVIRNQIHDFFNVEFDQDLNRRTFQLEGGKRFHNVPCMIRSIRYNLDSMTLQMKLWSLGTTEFDGYTPPGRTVGGQHDPIVLTSIGRLGRFSAAAPITAIGSDTLTLAPIDGQTAEDLSTAEAGAAFVAGYKYALVDATTQETLQTLTVSSVSGNVVTFEESIDPSATLTVLDGAGFPESGHYLEQAQYPEVTEGQRSLFASFSKPTSAYPTSKTSELEEQRGGLHSFADGGLPYVLYPQGFTSY